MTSSPAVTDGASDATSPIVTSLTPERLRTFGLFVDRLVTLDIQTRSQHFGLYQAAFDLQGEPLCLRAARTMIEAIRPQERSTALFTTGFFSPAYWCGEQDGPVGVACLARALETGLDVRSVIATDEELVAGVEAACRGAGYKTFDVEHALTVPKGRGIAVVGISKDEGEALIQVQELMDRVQPGFVAAVERPSANSKGHYHNLRGLNMTPLTGKTDCVFEEAQRRGIVTIAVGDGGNELGYGAIERGRRGSAAQRRTLPMSLRRHSCFSHPGRRVGPLRSFELGSVWHHRQLGCASRRPERRSVGEGRSPITRPGRRCR